MKATMIKLSSVPYFRNEHALQRLNQYLVNHSEFMVHQLAVYTGCALDEALAVCFLLYHYKQAEIYLLLYRDDLEFNPICTIKMSDGLPDTPFYSEDNDIEIENLDNITYSFWFVMNNDASPIVIQYEID